MELLLLLTTAHFVADFYVQPYSWIICRNNHHFLSLGLWKHVATHSAIYTLILLYQNFSILKIILCTLLLGISHLLIDLWKSYRPNQLRYFLLDQFAHLFIIVLLWLKLSNIHLADIHNYLKSAISSKTLTYVLAYLIVCKPTSILIQQVLHKYSAQFSQENSGLPSAGTWIGYLERSLVLTFILVGQFAGKGFLVATKTIFRFGDLTRNKDMQLTEYMMLGTLFSFSIALTTGWTVQYLLK